MKKILFFGFAALLLVAFTAPAMAAEKKVSFYGDFRFNTYWYKMSKDYVTNTLGLYNPQEKSESQLMYEPDFGDSRFGARFAEGPLSANVELRPVSDSIYRQWWGEYDFGSFQLLIGHTYTPACVAFDMSQFDSESGVLYGDLMSRLRTNQIRITVPFAMGSFKIAAQNNPENDAEFTGPAYTNYLKKLTLPEFEACLTVNAGPATVDLFGGYATYKYEDPAGGSESVNSNLWGAKVNVPFGPLYVTAEFYGAKNPANYGELTSSSLHYTTKLIDTTTGQTNDSTLKGYGGLLGYKLNDMVTAEFGYFTEKVERYAQESDDNGTYYLVFAVTPVKGLTIYPEIGVRDEKNIVAADGTKTKQGKRSYIGAYWKISF
jgi:hypothetical protein